MRDAVHWREWTGPRRVGSVHFGGGTPSLLSESQLSHLIAAVDATWGLPEGTEVALEANPNAVTPEAVAAWQRSGLTRLSLGVQSFDDAVLARLGRDHDGAQARAAVARAADGFASASADLIFGVEGEPDGRLEADIDILLAAGLPHVSAYQLTVEPDTAFGRRASRGERLAFDDDRSAAGMARIDARLSAAGFHRYEISNYARPGHESRHNLAYWRGQDYVGLGPGAHGRLSTPQGRVATETARQPAAYIAAVAAHGTGITRRERLSPEDAANEYVMMGLRVAEGLSVSTLSRLRGAALDVDPALLEGGWLERTGDRLRATEAGRPVLDAISRALLLG